MFQEKVSIVLPSYNGEKFIRESINSCLDQTYKSIELIIVDDGSTDKTSDIVKSYKDERIIYLKHGKNLGQARALNTGFSNAAGGYLTWTSDDNIYLPSAIETMVRALERGRKIDFVYANFYEINEDGEILRPVKVRPPKSLNMVNYIGLCFLYKRIIYEELGGYDPEAFLVEDYEYWLRVYHGRFRMKKLNQYLYYLRFHKDCLTVRYDSDEVAKQAQKVRDKYIPAALRYYQHGWRAFYKEKDHESAKKLLMKAVILNPFNYQAWRLLALLYLNSTIVEKIRRFKRSLKP